jgi:4'-phosphopantetheinyl transferase EntD
MAGQSIIGSLLPTDVASVEATASMPTDVLFSEEMALIQRAVLNRRAEFATARWCAREALIELGVGPVAILSGPDREPLWPKGIVGSITHCRGYHAAAVARAANVRSIGIDAEPDEPLAEGTLQLIALPVERAQLAAPWGPHLDRLLFSAKESVYKTWFPLARRWLGFGDAVVTLHQNGSFDVDITVAGPFAALTGYWIVNNDIIVTAITLLAQSPKIAAEHERYFCPTPRRSRQLCGSDDRKDVTEAREVAAGGFLTDVGRGT